MENAKPIATPTSTLTKLDANDGGNKADITMFRCMMGSFLYLIDNGLDIMFSICICARFRENSKESHLIAIKRLL